MYQALTAETIPASRTSSSLALVFFFIGFVDNKRNIEYCQPYCLILLKQPPKCKYYRNAYLLFLYSG